MEEHQRRTNVIVAWQTGARAHLRRGHPAEPDGCTPGRSSILCHAILLKLLSAPRLYRDPLGHHHQGNANAAIGRHRVIKPHTWVWLASHELRLGWRDWIAIMTAGRRRPMRNVAVALIIFGGLMHLLSYSMVGRYAGARIEPDKPTLIVVTGIMLLSWSLLLSQAMELVTRVFYSRSDLELILTSPISSAQNILGAHRPYHRRGCGARHAPGGTFHRRAGGSRRRPLARRVWRGRRYGGGGRGCCCGAHASAVRYNRPQAHAASSRRSWRQ